MKMEHKKILVKELFFNCPLELSLNQCFAGKFRKLPIKLRMKIVDAMNMEEVEDILINHRECRRKRENDLVNKGKLDINHFR